MPLLGYIIPTVFPFYPLELFESPRAPEPNLGGMAIPWSQEDSFCHSHTGKAVYNAGPVVPRRYIGMALPKGCRGDTRPGELVFSLHFLLTGLFEDYMRVVALVIVVVIMGHH